MNFNRQPHSTGIHSLYSQTVKGLKLYLFFHHHSYDHDEKHEEIEVDDH